MNTQEVLLLIGVCVGVPVIGACALLYLAGMGDLLKETAPTQEEPKPSQTSQAIQEMLDRYITREAQRLYASCFTEVAREFDPQGTYTQGEWIAYAHEVATAVVSFQFNQKEEEKHERHPQ